MGRIEFHRQALALLPETEDKKPGVATFVKKPQGEDVDRFCTCSVYKRATCRHILELTQVYKKLHSRFGAGGLSQGDKIFKQLALDLKCRFFTFQLDQLLFEGIEFLQFDLPPIVEL